MTNLLASGYYVLNIIRRDIEDVFEEFGLPRQMYWRVERAFDLAPSPMWLWREMDQILAEFMTPLPLRRRVEYIFQRALTQTGFGQHAAAYNQPFFASQQWNNTNNHPFASQWNNTNNHPFYASQWNNTYNHPFASQWNNTNNHPFASQWNNAYNHPFASQTRNGAFGNSFQTSHWNNGAFGNPFAQFNNGSLGNPFQTSQWNNGSFGNPYAQFNNGAFGNPFSASQFSNGAFGNPYAQFNNGSFGNPYAQFNNGAFGNPYAQFNNGSFGNPFSASQFNNGSFGYEDFTPPVQILETQGDYLVRVDLPGVREHEVETRVTGDNVLVIRGERRDFASIRNNGFGYGSFRFGGFSRGAEYNEQAQGIFTRTIPLPRAIDGTRVQALLRNGVLEIRAPKFDSVSNSFNNYNNNYNGFYGLNNFALGNLQNVRVPVWGDDTRGGFVGATFNNNNNSSWNGQHAYVS